MIDAGKVIVLGSVNVNLLVSTPRLPSAGETVSGSSLTRHLGADGVAIIRQNKVQRIEGRPAKVVDTTGAGDCFCGYLAAGLARGDTMVQAAFEANAAAAVAVQSFGAAASIPDRATVLQNIASIAARTDQNRHEETEV